MNRLLTRFAKRHPRLRQAGLALLDVLLGMAIFALIAVIAVQAMGQFRERAYVTQVTSDAKQAGTAIEAGRTEPGVNAYPAAVSPSGAEIDGLNLTEGVQVGAYRVDPVGDGSDAFEICMEKPGNGAHAVYDSGEGAVLAAGREGGCEEGLMDAASMRSAAMAAPEEDETLEAKCAPGRSITTSNAEITFTNPHTACGFVMQVASPWELFPGAGDDYYQEENFPTRIIKFDLEVRSPDGQVISMAPQSNGTIKHDPAKVNPESDDVRRRHGWHDQVSFGDLQSELALGVYTYTMTVDQDDFCLHAQNGARDNPRFPGQEIECSAPYELVPARSGTVSGSFEVTSVELEPLPASNGSAGADCVITSTESTAGMTRTVVFTVSGSCAEKAAIVSGIDAAIASATVKSGSTVTATMPVFAGVSMLTGPVKDWLNSNAAGASTVNF